MRLLFTILAVFFLCSACTNTYTNRQGTEYSQSSLRAGQVKEGSRVSFELIDGRSFDEVKVIEITETMLFIEQNGDQIGLPIGEVKNIKTSVKRVNWMNTWLAAQTLFVIGLYSIFIL